MICIIICNGGQLFDATSAILVTRHLGSIVGIGITGLFNIGAFIPSIFTVGLEETLEEATRFFYEKMVYEKVELNFSKKLKSSELDF